jgi:TonB family protein
MPSTGQIHTASPLTTADTAETEDASNMPVELDEATLLKDLRQPKPGEMSFKKAATASLGLHLLAPPALLIVALLVAWMLHWEFWSWFNPKPKKPDLTFTLVLDTHAKRLDKALHKGQFNQKAGGKQKANTPPKPKLSDPPPKTMAQVGPEPATPTPTQAKTETSAPTKTRPTPQQTVAIKKPTPTEASKPLASTTPLQTQATPVTTEVPTQNEAASNPQNGPAQVDGVDVVQDVDFGPFMADLEKRIKHNWVPPRGAESRKVRLTLYLLRDGKLLKTEISTSSGDQNADQAAVAAAEASAPFMAIPAQIKEDVLPVEFTFDYNVLNPHKRHQL